MKFYFDSTGSLAVSDAPDDGRREMGIRRGGGCAAYFRPQEMHGVSFSPSPLPGPPHARVAWRGTAVPGVSQPLLYPPGVPPGRPNSSMVTPLFRTVTRTEKLAAASCSTGRCCATMPINGKGRSKVC